MDVSLVEAQAFLNARYDGEAARVAEIGAGAWSRCFAFTHRGRDLVIRFGKHVDDFQKDRFAYGFLADGLPIPEMLEIGDAFGGYFAVSTRVFGIPLESLDAARWRAVVPSVAAALEAMRTADLGMTSGFGGWDARGQGGMARWSDHLLAVADDLPERRTHGWLARLETRPRLHALFWAGYTRLQNVADDTVPRSLAHCDLINRNVLVDTGPAGDAITGVFDWGCSIYGDHLYDLAWFDYWSPWYPDLDMGLLWSAVGALWRAAGYTPENLEPRLTACYLHIGLDHFAYNAWLEDWSALDATADRMQALVPLA